MAKSNSRIEPQVGVSRKGPLPPTQLLQKNLDRIRGTHLWLVGMPRDESLPSLFAGRGGVLFSFDYGAHLLNQRLVAASGSALQPQFGVTGEAPDSRPDVIVAYLQKGREATALMLAMVAEVVSPGGTVFLVGENSAGIRSSAELVEERVGSITFSDAARHCVLYQATVSGGRPPVVLETWEKWFSVTTVSGPLKIISLPGVFSHGRLDEGTALLLDHLPANIRGNVLDFGCGAGVVGAAVRALHPACDVSLVDSSALALQATRRTFAANGLTAKSIRPADGFVGVDERFDVILSNPPFHQGIATQHDVATGFLTSCAQHLNPKGFVVVVANRFLPYEPLIAKSLALSVIAETSRYKVLMGTQRS